VIEIQGHLFPGNPDNMIQRRSKATFFRVQSHLFPGWATPKATFFRVKTLPKATFILVWLFQIGPKVTFFLVTSDEGGKVTFFRVGGLSEYQIADKVTMS